MINLLSLVSGILTFASLVVTIRIPVAATWLPYVLWGAVAVCLLLLLMLGFIANYTYHVRVVGELTEAKESEVSKLNQEITSLREAHEKNVNGLTTSHESAITTLNQSHKTEIERLTHEHSQIIETQSQKLTELQANLDEALSQKLTFELDCEALRSEVELEDYSDDEDDHIYCVRALLKMRFINNDVHSVLVRRISLSIVRDAGAIETLLPDNRFPVTWQSASSENTYFRGLSVPASTPTDDYWFHFRAEVPHELNEHLKPGADLRVTMDASRQKPYFRDLVINWRAAERGPHSIVTLGEHSII